jgi:hypothetical protein
VEAIPSANARCLRISTAGRSCQWAQVAHSCVYTSEFASQQFASSARALQRLNVRDRKVERHARQLHHAEQARLTEVRKKRGVE